MKKYRKLEAGGIYELILLVKLIGLILLLLIMGFCQNAYATVAYVDSAATGSANGTDWTNAFTNLPYPTVVDTLYVADGTYNNHALGWYGLEWPVVILKATEANHGTDTGWSSEKGEGQAFFTDSSPLGRLFLIYADDIEINGISRDGPRSNNGFVIYLPDSTNVNDYDLIDIGNSADNFTLKYTELRNAGMDNWEAGGAGANNAQRNLSIYSAADEPDTTHDNIMIDSCWLHDSNSISIIVSAKVTNLTIQNCVIENVSGAPHGDGMHFFGGHSNNVIVRNNDFKDIRGEAIWYSSQAYTYNNYLFHGNTLISSDPSKFTLTGIMTFKGDVSNYYDIDAYNNSHFNTSANTSGYLLGSSVSGSDVENNLWYGSGTVAITADSHDYNFSEEADSTSTEANGGDLSGDPYSDTDSLTLAVGSVEDLGKDLSAIFTHDRYGVEYGSVGSWPVGAHEYQGGSPPVYGPFNNKQPFTGIYPFNNKKPFNDVQPF